MCGPDDAFLVPLLSMLRHLRDYDTSKFEGRLAASPTVNEMSAPSRIGLALAASIMSGEASMPVTTAPRRHSSRARSPFRVDLSRPIALGRTAGVEAKRGVQDDCGQPLGGREDAEWKREKAIGTNCAVPLRRFKSDNVGRASAGLSMPLSIVPTPYRLCGALRLTLAKIPNPN